LEQEQIVLKEQAGLLWTWWKGDPLPSLPPSPDFTFTVTNNIEALATLMEVPNTHVMHLLQEGHHPYLAYSKDLPVAVGWSASGRAQFGEGRVTFQVPPMNRYLHYFITLPSWRGQGIYPRLLQYILNSERNNNERFWIIHQLSNIASERGIHKAGFRIASKVYFLDTGKLGLVSPTVAMERAYAGARLLGLPLIKHTKDAQ
jgi:GNAT superfamily N-acetyltransferase